MGAEIDRIIDRKTVRNRVQYLVVWKGFGEESNTWCVSAQSQLPRRSQRA
jgi:hypothetical protein